MGEDIEKRRKRNNAWQRKNFKLFGVKLYREDAEDFEKYCRDNDISVNACLKKYIAECLGRPLTIRSEAKVDGEEDADDKE